MGLEDYDDPRRVEARRKFEAERTLSPHLDRMLEEIASGEARQAVKAAVETAGSRDEENEMAHEVSESEIDEAVARAFGRAPASSVELFRQAGFCEEDAVLGARLIESGKYMGFEDVATSMGVFDVSRDFARRNPDVTPRRIAEVAKRAAGGPSVTEVSKGVSEADFDALDDEIFGRPGGAR